MGLSLIQQAGDSKHFYFNIGSKLSMPPEIIVAACLEFASFLGENTRTIAVSRLLYEQGSPGQVFKLIEGSICAAIEKVASYFSDISISDTAGLVQFSYSDIPSSLADRILENYYKNICRMKEA